MCLFRLFIQLVYSAVYVLKALVSINGNSCGHWYTAFGSSYDWCCSCNNVSHAARICKAISNISKATKRADSTDFS